ncbi:MAG: 1-acyl-sn-glycerol-3-phosphate acyltransferase [Lachnospiraceae bacterium]|nr:1-acyl-sn-glycerol-3-phosphate acyltransferase [Lachnospiraceae bacterium]
MDEYTRHQKIWKVLWHLVHRPLCRRFRFTCDELNYDGPCLLISNHVTNWDPLLLAMSLRKHQAYFVASEHIFRQGIISKILLWLLGPIARKKAGSAAATVMDCMRHLSQGHSIVLFAEGDCTWDGETQPVFPATGKLAKRCGAALVTYRLEGGYFSFPRWGKRQRRGRMHGRIVHIYTPEQLKGMKPDEITQVINRDLYENAWTRQQEEPVVYRTGRPAECLESSLFLCPSCGKFSGLRSRKDTLFCSCGASWKVSFDGKFTPAEPFADVASWDHWQSEALEEAVKRAGDPLFSDADVEFTCIEEDGSSKKCRTSVVQHPDFLEVAGEQLAEKEISDMAIIKNRILVFSGKRHYYEVRMKKGGNVRKYLAYLHLSHSEASEQ